MEAGGEAAGQLRCTGGGSVLLLLVSIHQALRPDFHSKRVRDSQSIVLSLPEQSGLLLHLTGCGCKGKSSSPLSLEEYDPVNQKAWTWLIYWVSARAGIKSPPSLDQQSLGFTQPPQGGALQSEPRSGSQQRTTLGFLTLIYYLVKSLACKIFLLFPQLCQAISRVS